MHTLASYLNATWQPADGPPRHLLSPTTGETIAAVYSGALDLEAALAYARDVGGPALRAVGLTGRGAMLAAMSQAIHGAREELIALSITHAGTTRKDAKFDIDGASGTLAFYAHLGSQLGGDDDRGFLLDGEQIRLTRSKRFVGQHLLVARPGVAVHINAFNFPAWNMAEKAACALLAGMPVLTKPATSTASVAHRVVALWIEAGILPDGALSLLCGSARDLLDHVRSGDCITFTGSGDTARTIKSHPRVLAAGVPVNVEADSLNAAILGPDCSPGSETFDMFATEVVREITQKAGQKCTAVRRVLVPEALLDATLTALGDRLEVAQVGDPAAQATIVGPLATAGQKRDIESGVTQLEAVAERVWGDPAAVPATGCFVAPQLFLARGGADAPFIHDHEIFGPVATLLPYSGDAAEAVAIAAATGGALVASVFSDDPMWAREVLLGLAPWHGRILWGSRKVHDQSTGHGAVMPGLVHGGPGQAGGGEELGGERGLRFYMQRTALQGDTALLGRLFG